MKIINIIFLIILIIVIIVIGGYFVARYYLGQAGYAYLFMHPTIAKIFNVTPICPTICLANGGVCGKDNKTYCNQCVAFQHGAGYAYDGACHPAGWTLYTNDKYGFQMSFPATWNGYSVVEENWGGQSIDGTNKTYSGTEIVIKNPQTTSKQQWQSIPIMVFTPDVWKMVSGNNPTVAVSAAPIGPARIGENSKYVFATPPRWYGFTDAIGWQEAVNIVATFKAY
jgi:hypothetical protein